MAKTPRRDDEPTRSRRVRAALAPLSRASVAATACILWVGLALPGLQLLPGAGGVRRQEHCDLAPERAARDRQRLCLDARSTRGDARTRTGGDQRVAGSAVADRRRGVARGRPRGEHPHRHGRHDGRPDTRLRRTAQPAERGDRRTGRSALRRTDIPPIPPGRASRRRRSAAVARRAARRRSHPRRRPRAAQSITFSTSPSDAFVGGFYVVGASASSGLPVSFSLAPGSSGVCTISGATVSFVGPGTCTVRANQAGNASYLAAPQVTQSMDVDDAVAVQTISFLSMPPSGAHVGDPAYNVNAKASSGLPVEFGTEGESAGICKVTGVKVHLIGEGTCTINATQRGNSKFKPAPPVQQSFSIGTDAASQSVQSINFTSTPPIGAGGRRDLRRCGDGQLGSHRGVLGRRRRARGCAPSPARRSRSSEPAPAPSGRTRQGTRATSPRRRCSRRSSSASSARRSRSRARRPRAPPSAARPTPSRRRRSSGLPVVFSANPSSASVCTVSGSTVSLTGAGTCTVDADQPGRRDARAGAAGPAVVHDRRPARAERPVDQLHLCAALGVGRRRRRPTRSPRRRARASRSPSPSRPRAPASARSPARRFHPSGSAPAPCVPTRRATRAIRPRRRSGSRSRSASQPQTISFTSSPPSSATVGDPDYVVGASATSGLAVVFSAARFERRDLHGLGLDRQLRRCRHLHRQRGSARRRDLRRRTSRAAVVHDRRPAGAERPVDQLHARRLRPARSSAGPRTGSPRRRARACPSSFSIDPASAGVCTLAGATVSFVGSGTCTIRADQAGNASYQAAPQVSAVLRGDHRRARRSASPRRRRAARPPAGRRTP